MSKDKRSVSDIPFFILSTVGLLALIIIFIFACLNGNPRAFLHVTDHNGHVCGKDQYKDRPYLMYIDYTSLNIQDVAQTFTSSFRLSFPGVSKCVSSCPKKLGVPSVLNHECVDGIMINNSLDLAKYTKKKLCQPFNIPNVAYFRHCVPDINAVFANENATYQLARVLHLNTEKLEKINQVKNQNEYFDTLEELVQDLIDLKYAIIGYGFTAIALSFVLVLVFSYLFFPVFIGIMILSTIVSAIVGALAIFLAVNLKQELYNNKYIEWVYAQVETMKVISPFTFFCLLASACIVLFLILLLMTCLFFSSLRIVGMCAQEASKSSIHQMASIFATLAYIAAQILLLILAFYLFLNLLTLREDHFRFININDSSFSVGNVCDGKDAILSDAEGFCSLLTDDNRTVKIVLILISLFLVIWQWYLIDGMRIYVVAYSYYTSFKRGTVIPFLGLEHTLRAIKTLFLFNFGSLALGSFITALICIIRIVFMIVVRLFRLDDDRRLRMMWNFFAWILKILQNFFDRINSFVYVQIAVSGEGYCRSSFRVMRLIGQYPLITIVIKVMGFFVKVIGNIFVSVATGFIAYATILQWVPTVKHPIYAAIVIGASSLVLSLAFMSNFETAILTYHFCVCKSLNRKAKGKEEKMFVDEKIREVYLNY